MMKIKLSDVLAGAACAIIGIMVLTSSPRTNTDKPIPKLPHKAKMRVAPVFGPPIQSKNKMPTYIKIARGTTAGAFIETNPSESLGYYADYNFVYSGGGGAGQGAIAAETWSGNDFGTSNPWTYTIGGQISVPLDAPEQQYVVEFSKFDNVMGGESYHTAHYFYFEVVAACPAGQTWDGNACVPIQPPNPTPCDLSVSTFLSLGPFATPRIGFSAHANATSSYPPVVYSWDYPAGAFDVTGQGTADLTFALNRNAGFTTVVSVTVTDSHTPEPCSATASADVGVTVMPPPLPPPPPPIDPPGPIDPISPICENPRYFRFPTQIVPSSAHSPKWMPQRVSSSGADARVRRQSRPYWSSDLSGCICNEELKDWIYSLLYRNYGMVRPVLNYVPTFCEIGVIVDRDSYGEAIVQPEYQATGTGVLATFQLRKKLVVPSYESEVATEDVYYDVNFPHVCYPPMKAIGRTIKGPILYVPMEELKIYANGVLQVRGVDYSVDRNTGVVTHAMTGVITATGGFYILMLMPNEIPMKSKGNGVYEINSGVKLEEMPGGH